MEQESGIREPLTVGIHSTPFDDAYPLIRRIAGARAAALARKYRLSNDDRRDLEQEAAFHIWAKLAVFDPTRSSSKTFIEHLVGNVLASHIRKRFATKRQSRPIDQSSLKESAGVDRLHLAIDIARVLRTLAKPERDIALLLREFSPTEVSRRTGLSRRMLYRIKDRLRLEFGAAGLNDYLRDRGATNSDHSQILRANKLSEVGQVLK